MLLYISHESTSRLPGSVQEDSLMQHDVPSWGGDSNTMNGEVGANVFISSAKCSSDGRNLVAGVRHLYERINGPLG